jgi:hypothetical protein
MILDFGCAKEAADESKRIEWLLSHDPDTPEFKKLSVSQTIEWIKLHRARGLGLLKLPS